MNEWKCRVRQFYIHSETVVEQDPSNLETPSMSLNRIVVCIVFTETRELGYDCTWLKIAWKFIQRIG